MEYVKIINSTVAEYPYRLRKLAADFPNVSFPKEPSAELLAEYGVFAVEATAKPASTATENPIELPPVLVNGVWKQTWGMTAASADEIVRRQVRADTFVKNFIAMSPAEVTAYVEANTGNLAQMRTVVGKMAVMLLMLAKREYK